MNETMVVIDTNVLSELMKPRDQRANSVVAWFGTRSAAQTFLTSVTVAEVLAAIAIMPPGRRRDEYSEVAQQIFSSLFRDRILAFDELAARTYPDVVARRRRKGMEVKSFDGQIAAIACSRNMIAATRNVRDFRESGAEIITPWDDGS